MGCRMAKLEKPFSPISKSQERLDVAKLDDLGGPPASSRGGRHTSDENAAAETAAKGSELPRDPIPNPSSPPPLPPFPLDGITLKVIEDFIESHGGTESFRGLSTSHVCNSIFKPMLNQKEIRKSWCDVLKDGGSADVGKATVFVSHAWNYKFLDVIDVLREFAAKAPTRVVFWFDLFSNNQFDTSARPFEWWCGTFRNAIKDLGHTLLVLTPWRHPVALTRAWCLFEIFTSIVTKANIDVVLTSADETDLIDVLSTRYDDIARSLCKITVEEAEAFNRSDRDAIFAALMRETTFGTVDGLVMSRIREWLIATAERYAEQGRSLRAALLRLHLDEGNYNKALALATELRRECTRGPESLEAMEGDHLLAMVHSRMGRYDEAERLFKIALQTSQLLLGSEHLETLAILNNLADLYDNLGNHKAAEEVTLRVLRLRQEKLGPDHALTLSTMNGLAGTYEAMGRYADALQIYEDVMRARLNVESEDHPLVLAAKGSIAGVKMKMGHYAEAKALCAQVVATRERVLGPTHPSTLASLQFMGAIHGRLGENDAAIEVYKRVASARDETLGVAHPATLSARNNLALTLMNARRLDESKVLFEKIIPPMEEVLGAAHPALLATKSNLAAVMGHQGLNADAVRLYREVLPHQQEALGVDHPSVLSTLNNLAVALDNSGSSEEAVRVYERVLEAQRRTIGAEHPHTLGTLNNLAFALERMGKRVEAARMYEEALAAQVKTLGDAHPDARASRNNLAFCLFESGNMRAALNHFFDLLLIQIRVQSLGPRSEAASNSIANVCNCVKRGTSDVRDAARLYLEQLKGTVDGDDPLVMQLVASLAAPPNPA